MLTGIRACILGRHTVVRPDHQHSERYEQLLRAEMTLAVDIIPLTDWAKPF